MNGQIVKINKGKYFVNFNNEVYDCSCRGILRKQNITPLVGDYVFFDKDKKVIDEILPRKNEFDRPSVSNIDQAFIVTSLKMPNFSSNLLDKFLVLMEIKNVKPIICITKEDLCSKEEIDSFKPILSYYESIGYTVVSNTEVDRIKELIKNKTSVFTGQTGSGKSTLLNKLNPNWDLKTGEISIALGRGKHTTRIVEILNFLDGKLLDTPGFSALDINVFKNEEIRDAFIEFKSYPCKFKDCSHTKEQECIIKKEVEKKNIMKSRYENYLKFIEGND